MSSNDASPNAIAGPDFALIVRLASRIERGLLNVKTPLVVGIDGPDCAGKSTYSCFLLQRFMRERRVLLVHCDDYLRDRNYRERRGEFSVDGFLFDYFDQDAIKRGVMDIASQQKSTDAVKPDIVLVEGMFLYRAPLDALFDLRIRMELDEDAVLARALARDVGVIGDESWVRRHYLEQCIPAQRVYRADAMPERRGDVVVRFLGGGEYQVREAAGG